MRKYMNWLFFIFILSLVLICTCRLQAQPKTLTNTSKISLLTKAPGLELYSAFGHSAIRVQDEAQGLDVVFNYGTFSFNTDNFYAKFIRGRLPYYLALHSFEYEKRSAIKEHRAMYEQIFNLNIAEKQAVYDFLLNNYKPENRTYLYDFFFDNCATRIYDVLEVSLTDSLHYPTAPISQNKSFRQLIDPYIKDNLWADFGIDLILGLPADRKATSLEYMFLPDELQLAFDQMKIISDDGNSKPLVSKTLTVYPAKPVQHNKPLIYPNLLLWVILLFTIAYTFWQYRSKLSHFWYDKLLFGLMGFLGVFFLLCWFCTDHKVLVMNLNMLWAVPFHILVIWWLKPAAPTWVSWYFGVTGALMVVLLVFWTMLPQSYHFAVFPLVMALGIRAFWIVKKQTKASIA